MSQAGISNVLIVDDELGPRESLKMILKPSFNVYTAENGRNALEIIEKTPVDLVTLDLKMPGMTGEEVLKQIKTRDPTIEVVIITGYGTLQSAVLAIQYNVYDYILKPFNVADILSTAENCIQRREMKVRIQDIFEEAKKDDKNLSKIQEHIAHFLNQSEEIYYSLKTDNYLEFVRVLATTLDDNDPYTAGHSERVSNYASMIADGLGIPDTKKRNLQISAYLHDIGKVGISSPYIFKEGPLNKNELAAIKEHPGRGVKIIGALKLPHEVIEGIKHHHERLDGKGYPDELVDGKIPLFARILAIADSYDAMRVGRPYKAAMSIEEAFLELKQNSGSQFDAELVDVFIRKVKER